MKRNHLFITYFCFVLSLNYPLKAQDQSYIDSLKLAIQETDSIKKLPDLYYEILLEYFSYDYDSSLRYAKLYLDASIAFNDSARINNAYQMVGFVYDQKGELRKANEYFAKGLKFSIEAQDSFYMSYAYNNYGYIQSYSADQPGSLVSFMKSLEIAEDIKDTFLISYASSNIGYYYEKMEDYKNAYSYYTRSHDLSIAAGDSFDISSTHASLALVCCKMKDFDATSTHLKASQDYISTLHNEYDYCNLYLTYIETYLEWKILDSVRIYLEKTESILENNEYKLFKAYLIRDKGYLAFLEKDYQACIDFLDHSIDLLLEIGDMEVISKVYSRIAEAYAKLGFFRQAYENQKLSDVHGDSLKTGEVAGILSKYEQERLDEINLRNAVLEYELVKQRNLRNRVIIWISSVSIVLLLFLVALVVRLLQKQRRTSEELAEQNRKISQQSIELEKNLAKISESEEELKKLIATKDRFFSIIAHDLKNPLSTIIGYSDLYLANNKVFPEKDMVTIMEGLNQMANYGFSILDNLLEWALSNTGDIVANPESLVLGSVIQKHVKDFKNIADKKNITIISDNHQISDVYVDANMLNTILRNLIHNAIKFSFEGGTINISYKEDKDHIEVCIADKGTGMPSEVVKSLFAHNNTYQKYGTGNEKGTGLGLILCMDFIQKNNGKIWAESELEKGSRFFFTLPLVDLSS